MSDIVPHIVSGVLRSHRILCHKAIAIACIAGTPDHLNDPPEILSFRYQALNKIYEIYNVNLSLSNHFDNTDRGTGDDYYLGIVERAFGELDDAFMDLKDLLCEVKPSSLSLVCRRMIEVWEYTSRLIPDEVTLHLGSLPTITAQPLTCSVLEQISIIIDFFDDIHRARTLFTEVLRRAETLTEDWQCCGFRSRSHFIRQVLLPIALTQFSGAAHFIRWLAISWRQCARRIRSDVTHFDAGFVNYDPERHLKLDWPNVARVAVPIKPAPWTAQFRGVWTYPEVGSYCCGLIQKQMASIAGQTLHTRCIQPSSNSSQRRALAFRNIPRISTALPGVKNNRGVDSSREIYEIQSKPFINMTEAWSKQNVFAPCYGQESTKLMIMKIDHFSRAVKHQNYLLCPHCSIRFCLLKDMERHIKTKHRCDGKVYYCPVKTCKRSRSQRCPFDRLDNWRRHVQTVHKIMKPMDTDVEGSAASMAHD